MQQIHLLPQRDPQDSHVCSANVILRGKQPLTHDRTMGVSLMTEDAMSGHVLVRSLRPLVKCPNFPHFKSESVYLLSLRVLYRYKGFVGVFTNIFSQSVICLFILFSLSKRSF